MGERSLDRLDALYGRDGQASVRSGLLGLLVFGVFLWLGTSLVRGGLSNLPGISVEESGAARTKALHWREHSEEYELVFIGSSRIYRQLDPRIFEESCAAGGLELRAYNWGLPGMKFFECLQRVEEILEERPQRLKWVVIELLNPAPQVGLRNLRSLREIKWHTPGWTRLAIQRSLASKRGPQVMLEQLHVHAYQGAARFLNLGLARNAWEQWLTDSIVLSADDRAGFDPLEQDPSADVRTRRSEFQNELRRNPDALESKARKLMARDRSVKPSRVLREQLKYLLRVTRAAGVEPIFILLPPAEQMLPQMVAAHERGSLPNLFDYSDPAQVGALYTNKQLRFDINHLNDKGLGRLTRRFAKDFVQHVEAQSSVLGE